MNHDNRLDDRTRALEICKLLGNNNAKGVELLSEFCGPSAKAFLSSRFRHRLNQIELDAAFNNALFKAWRYGHSIDINQNLGAWFCRICNNEAIDLCQQMPKPSNYDFSQIAIVEGAVKQLESCDEKNSFVRSLNSEIEKLPNLQKRIVLADLQAGGEEHAVILADQFDTTANSIRVSRSKARSKLRRRLKIDQGTEQSLST